MCLACLLLHMTIVLGKTQNADRQVKFLTHEMGWRFICLYTVVRDVLYQHGKRPSFASCPNTKNRTFVIIDMRNLYEEENILL
jgi:hypothetical protein